MWSSLYEYSELPWEPGNPETVSRLMRLNVSGIPSQGWVGGLQKHSDRAYWVLSTMVTTHNALLSAVAPRNSRSSVLNEQSVQIVAARLLRAHTRVQTDRVQLPRGGTRMIVDRRLQVAAFVYV